MAELSALLSDLTYSKEFPGNSFLLEAEKTPRLLNAGKKE
jgi:hypothetical protein